MKRILRGMVVVLGCLLLLSQVAQAQTTKRISGDSWFGATTKAKFSKLVNYVLEKDEPAFKKALTVGLLNETVTVFKNGEVVYIVDTAIFSGLVKVRKRGETTEYWTNLEAVK